MKPAAHSDPVLLAHMLECIARIREYTGAQRETFFGSHLVQDAVIRNLQVMAQSDRRLSADAKAIEPSVQWSKVAGMRNILVHQYLGGIDFETVRSVIDRDLGPPAEALEHIRSGLEHAP